LRQGRIEIAGQGGLLVGLAQSGRRLAVGVCRRGLLIRLPAAKWRGRALRHLRIRMPLEWPITIDSMESVGVAETTTRSRRDSNACGDPCPNVPRCEKPAERPPGVIPTGIFRSRWSGNKPGRFLCRFLWPGDVDVDTDNPPTENPMGRGRKDGLQESWADPTPCLDAFPGDDTLDRAELDLSEGTSRRSPFPWQGQFSPQLIGSLLGAFFPDRPRIIDPFVGSGTLLREAALLGMPAAGAEISLAAFALARTHAFANAGTQRRQSVLQRVGSLIDAAPTNGVGTRLADLS